ncbi:hypothetical protein [Kitasatospora sp. NPDC088351]|uniref:hypothetical protein n=1 Tax=unclassified Kitasatospora TaxID=2633591 RepID=UPI00342B7882
MPTRQLRDERPPTTPDDTRDAREPVLIGDVIFAALADIARRTPEAPPRFPAQRTRPHP